MEGLKMNQLLKASIFFLIVFFNMTSYAQTYTAGGGLNFASAEKTGSEIGISGVFEYRTNIHYAYRLNFRILYSDGIKDPYFPGYTYFLPGLDASFVYYPVKWAIEPYAGAGIGYFFPSASGPNGNSRDTPEGDIFSSDIKSSYGLNALAGLKLSADTPISLFLEFKYHYFRPQATYLFSDGHRKDGKFNGTSLITSLSIVFVI